MIFCGTEPEVFIPFCSYEHMTCIVGSYVSILISACVWGDH